MDEVMLDNSLCETEFARVGLTFWTDESRPQPFDSHTAASVGDTEVSLQYISTLPLVELDCVNKGGWTPLMYACYLGHCGLASYLLSRGCDHTATSSQEGKTPLMLAAMCGNSNIVELLVDKFGRQVVEQADNNNYTALFHSVATGHQDVVEYLLCKGSNPNMTEHKKGYSILMMAASEGNLPLVELLLQHGANYTYQTVLGDTAQSVAEARGHDMVARSFLRLMMKHSGGQATFPTALDGPAQAELLLQQKKMAQRNSMTLDRFLQELGLEKYLHHFKEQEIDFQLLLTLNDQDLKQVGITLLGPRRKLTAAIRRWLGGNSSLAESEKKIIS